EGAWHAYVMVGGVSERSDRLCRDGGDRCGRVLGGRMIKKRAASRPWHPQIADLSPFDRAKLDAVIKGLETPDEEAKYSASLYSSDRISSTPPGRIALLAPGCYMKGRGRS